MPLAVEIQCPAQFAAPAGIRLPDRFSASQTHGAHPLARDHVMLEAAVQFDRVAADHAPRTGMTGAQESRHQRMLFRFRRHQGVCPVLGQGASDVLGAQADLPTDTDDFFLTQAARFALAQRVLKNTGSGDDALELFGRDIVGLAGFPLMQGMHVLVASTHGLAGLCLVSVIVKQFTGQSRINSYLADL